MFVSRKGDLDIDVEIECLHSVDYTPVIFSPPGESAGNLALADSRADEAATLQVAASHFHQEINEQ